MIEAMFKFAQVPCGIELHFKAVYANTTVVNIYV